MKLLHFYIHFVFLCFALAEIAFPLIRPANEINLSVSFFFSRDRIFIKFSDENAQSFRRGLSTSHGLTFDLLNRVDQGGGGSADNERSSVRHVDVGGDEGRRRRGPATIVHP